MYLCVSVWLVESYTRESGVRTLERRIGALCRAVAVKVAEHLDKLSVDKQSTVEEQASVSTGRQQELAASETVDIMNVSQLKIPPKLPIVIDVAAVEDILGVCIHDILGVCIQDMLRVCIYDILGVCIHDILRVCIYDILGVCIYNILGVCIHEILGVCVHDLLGVCIHDILGV